MRFFLRVGKSFLVAVDWPRLHASYMSVTRRLRNRRLQKKSLGGCYPSYPRGGTPGATPANNIGHRTRIAMENLLRTLPMVLAKQARSHTGQQEIGTYSGMKELKT